MTRQQMMHAALGTVVVLGLGGTAQVGWATDDDDGVAIPFDVATVFFELNNTDGDLGIHALVDGEPWKKLEIEDPSERKMLVIRLSRSLRKQGLTELFFESAEPTFDELAPEKFFRRFPEGDYEVSGKTLTGEERESLAPITHLLPAAPEIEVDGMPVPEDCDLDPGPEADAEPFVSWEPIMLSHPFLGRTNEPIEIDRYELVVEREEPPLKITIDLTPDVTGVELPEELFEPGDELKVEVLAREVSGNQTATESCFRIESAS